ncbi:adenylate/guanylate cyclase domain-containing protein [Microvirga thermotolerans]|uniref:Adenylate/guanylate cyclase domain-containing protein n=1 Tax=Microvirga thermotolerans TaxID=2651334 RepID=A0A5P9JSF1_9HYPH|nr:adenylate/guanylate cyclase domain-containing protein [Microvirga thermotolerans]QFU15019.1 adenylate/guanylate cyclase domain-containing protein [Microvirga thermotolerans]
MKSRVSSAWSSLRRLGTRRSLSDATDRLMREADAAALRRAGFARVVVAGLLLATVLVATQNVPASSRIVVHQVRAAEMTLTLLGAVGFASAWLASRRIAVAWLPAVTATLDALLVFMNIGYSHWVLGIPGSFFSVFPGVWVIPVTMAASAIHYSPRLQAYVAALYVSGLGFLVLSGASLSFEERTRGLSEFAGQVGWEANMARVAMLLSAGLILVLVAGQGRALLERAVRETTLRLNLTRYLPRELAPILSERAFASLRAGRRIPVTLLFVDMRDSSAYGETMDPARLAVFISSFRRRVMRAAARHGGVIDKFTGDGALILFGVPAASADDAARALACGRTLFALIDRWNAKRGFDPPVRIGVGIHTGEVFCGVVGDEDRLEFTVLGETVNTAARIEQATKAADCPFLVSAPCVAAAGEADRWIPVENLPLPGVTRPIRLMKPAP